MKKLAFIILLFTWFHTFSQQKNRADNFVLKKNEIKFEIVKLVLIPILEVEYEHQINFQTSVGGNFAFLPISSLETLYDFYSDIFVRFYFHNKKYGMSGLFAQPYLSYLYRSKKEDIITIFKPVMVDAYNSTGIGIALGYKWINKSGISIQGLLGLGRNFNKASVLGGYVPRIGIFIGLRL